ncbi:MAG: YidC/Oxa1 family membrane protein insertase [bacterium]|nr:YidC/Oxa1 family membrane protein insertase [bacterium]
MSLIFLTQENGSILGPIAKVLGVILNWLAEFLNIFGIQNTGITLILFTFIVNTLMLPLTIKQYKFQKIQSSLAPELARIQKKYKNKKDEVSMRKQQMETQELYQKYGANPMAGCLPMLITLPILFALYRVVYHIPAYVDLFYNQYADFADKLISIPDIGTVIQNANIQLSQPLQVGFENWANYSANDIVLKNNVVEFLSQLKSADWKTLSDQLGNVIQNPEQLQVIRTSLETTQAAAHNMNSFLGLNVVESVMSTGPISPAAIVPLLAGGLQFIQTKMMPQTDNNPDSPTASTLKTMNYVMPLMSVVFCFMFPIGVGLYWVAGSLYRIVQQLFVNRYMDRINIDDLVKKNVEKQNKKRAKAGLEPLKMEAVSKARTKDIPTVEEKAKASKKKNEPSDYSRSDVSYKAGSISANARLLNKKNGEKGDK